MATSSDLAHPAATQPNECSATSLLAGRPSHSAFRDIVLRGLSQSPKRLPGKYALDRRGAMLAEATCAQPECYLPRAEQNVWQSHGPDIAAEIGQDAMLIAFQAGTGFKKWQLMKLLPRPSTYVPIELAPEHLLTTIDSLGRVFDLPSHFDDPVRRVVHMPGTALETLEPTVAIGMLGRLARLSGPAGGLLVGIDLATDPNVIERSYNDRAGVRAELNLNLLLRINRELGGEFDLNAFQHLASYDNSLHRMNIRLMSRIDQQVRVAGRTFHFNAGEAIHTQYAYKYSVESFNRLACQAGLALRRSWTDARQQFALLYLANESCRD